MSLIEMLKQRILFSEKDRDYPLKDSEVPLLLSYLSKPLTFQNLLNEENRTVKYAVAKSYIVTAMVAGFVGDESEDTKRLLKEIEEVVSEKAKEDEIIRDALESAMEVWTKIEILSNILGKDIIVAVMASEESDGWFGEESDNQNIYI